MKERSVERRLRKSVLRIEGIASFGNERCERALNYLLRFVVFVESVEFVRVD